MTMSEVQQFPPSAKDDLIVPEWWMEVTPHHLLLDNEVEEARRKTEKARMEALNPESHRKEARISTNRNDPFLAQQSEVNDKKAGGSGWGKTFRRFAKSIRGKGAETKTSDDTTAAPQESGSARRESLRELQENPGYLMPTAYTTAGITTTSGPYVRSDYTQWEKPAWTRTRLRSTPRGASIRQDAEQMQASNMAIGSFNEDIVAVDASSNKPVSSCRFVRGNYSPDQDIFVQPLNGSSNSNIDRGEELPLQTCKTNHSATSAKSDAKASKAETWRPKKGEEANKHGVPSMFAYSAPSSTRFGKKSKKRGIVKSNDNSKNETTKDETTKDSSLVDKKSIEKRVEKRYCLNRGCSKESSTRPRARSPASLLKLPCMEEGSSSSELFHTGSASEELLSTPSTVSQQEDSNVIIAGDAAVTVSPLLYNRSINDPHEEIASPEGYVQYGDDDYTEVTWDDYTEVTCDDNTEVSYDTVEEEMEIYEELEDEIFLLNVIHEDAEEYVFEEEVIDDEVMSSPALKSLNDSFPPRVALESCLSERNSSMNKAA